jgi:hypothetical protein
MKYIVSNREELAELRNATLKMSLRSIAIESNAVQDARIEKQLNRHYFACGCQSGSVCVLLTLLVSVIVGFMYGFHGTMIWWRILIYMAVAAIAGKCIGLLWSYVRLRKLYRQLGSLLPPKAQLIS